MQLFQITEASDAATKEQSHTHSTANKKILICTFCCKTYLTKPGLWKHTEKMHKNEKIKAKKNKIAAATAVAPEPPEPPTRIAVCEKTNVHIIEVPAADNIVTDNYTVS